MALTLEEFKKKYSNIAQALIREGREKGWNAAKAVYGGSRSEKLNADGEKDAEVKSDQLLPGHEAPVGGMMSNGTTIEPEAAIQALAAERKAQAASRCSR